MTSNLIGPRDHTAWLSEYTRLDGISEITWAMPNGEKRVTLQMTAGPTLLQRTWDLLDAEVDLIFDPSGEYIEYHKNRARAIAEVLAMFMVPHFASADEISKEAMKRRKAREAGDTEYETAGLGSRRYEPPAAAILERAREQGRNAPAKTKTRAPRTPRRVQQPTGKRIPEQAIETAKQGISTGMFTVAQIATGYGMTEAEVKAQLGLD